MKTCHFLSLSSCESVTSCCCHLVRQSLLIFDHYVHTLTRWPTDIIRGVQTTKPREAAPFYQEGQGMGLTTTSDVMSEGRELAQPRVMLRAVCLVRVGSLLS